MALVQSEPGETPLQEKLGVLAGAISKVGLAVGVLSFVVLMVRWMIQNKGFPMDQFAQGPLNYFIFAVTIVVVAVPEGLPLAVTISLAYSMKKMMRDNNFVRVLAACETMGGATAICSDKTGTLTENRMTVVEGWFCGTQHASVPELAEMPAFAAEQIQLNIALNSKAFLIEHDKENVEFVGNRTECALLMLLRRWRGSYRELREAHHDRLEKLYGFSSERKMASVLYRIEGGALRLYNKGAAEMVLARCTQYADASGAILPMSDALRDQLLETVTEMASRGLRTLCLSYTDFAAEDAARPVDFFDAPPDEDLIAIAIVGIKDPLRAEVPGAVATCKRAGICVRMVTGDNVHTAQHIARECGILGDGGLALEGPNFRKMPDDELVPLLPKLQVLARSSPQDKYKLVQLLKRQGEVVAVTGDGTNDAPALKESDVGLAMGIAGTEVAKEAADIVILDDNFSSIVKAVMWGRSVFNNIRKFLQFQLTINFVALVLAFVAAVGSSQTPLNVLQLLWVNLIMDSFAALALATEHPTPDLLLQKPHGRDESLISRRMWRHMLGQGCYQLFWLFLIFYGAPVHLSAYEVPSAGSTLQYDDYISYAGVEVNKIASGTNLTGIPTYSLNDNKGPRINACCKPGVNCLTTDPQPGWYTSASAVICSYTGAVPAPPGPYGTLAPPTKITKPNQDNLCGSAPSDTCKQLFNTLNNVYKQGNDQNIISTANGREGSNSLIFNVFIFCQVFNMINCRKIDDEYNVLSGLLGSRIFIVIWVFIIGMQIIIVETLGSFFKLHQQSWQEWLVAVAIGLGAIPVSLIIKFFSRRLHGSPPRRRGSATVEAL